MFVPEHIKTHPNYVLLSEHFEPEQVERIIESNIPLNRPGVVPSLQVPPGNQGCQGLGDWMADVPLSTIGTQRTQEVGFWQTFSNALSKITSQPQPQIQTAVPHQQSAPPANPDPALDWVESNWMLIAAALGGLLILGVATKK